MCFGLNEHSHIDTFSNYCTDTLAVGFSSHTQSRSVPESGGRVIRYTSFAVRKLTSTGTMTKAVESPAMLFVAIREPQSI